MNDKQLDLLLKAADLPSVAQPSFTRDIWRDIEHRQLGDSRAPWLDSLLDLLAMPKLRLAVWAVALSGGIFAGIRSSLQPADPVAIYAHAINPLAPSMTP
ncbi:hypothetical protein SAMN02745166_02353 [Prosthecobacter debontii]|uniref:Uncharacterized protein n=1 Tax=Prosthecobacter debontii TaxID=48467 RepID=A0A1T4Y2R4_9BACT|nr:hypothetical protein [Prosthecobacter debontii]SKA96104.1 hypothetical protein SAMN02745166_02353 [Prosthecobacter debontii]